MKKIILISLLSCLVAGAVWAQKDTVTTNSGLKYVMLKKGNGEKPEEGSKLWVNYTVKLKNGKVVESSMEQIGEPYKFKLGDDGYIPAWNEMFALMSEGEKAYFYVPAAIGYGKYGNKDVDGRWLIKPHTDIIFEAEIVKMK